MPKKLSLDEATTIIGKINTLDTKLVSVIDMHDQTEATIAGNNKEIVRLESLKKANEDLKAKSVSLKTEVEAIKGEINSMSRVVKEAGWVVPIPRREVGATAAVRM